jgi:hypothetical protein
MRSTTPLSLLLATSLGVGIAACDEDPVAPLVTEAAALISVVPLDGAIGVDPTAPVTLVFDHAVMEGMEDFLNVHEGSLSGPAIAGSRERTTDGRTIMFRPSAPLAPATTYVVHVGGGMMGPDGTPVDLGAHGPAMGGDWVTGSMMGPGASARHGADGWRHPSNGSYGMVFAFTTG